ncbi:hypothetical protein SAMN04488061_2703 [Filomicrobium insigne]|uniref:Uncharacterized protein n=1 Tax=Filomicrobium insigne TaxID=418854 RepID=A0A1H0RGD4_9HYPH|nr:hypothetical protein [Filomicrobium insigne]SDP27958.1 hypothetical protein SAMN04488061_2703 [Filomicrobium insigne]
MSKSLTLQIAKRVKRARAPSFLALWAIAFLLAIDPVATFAAPQAGKLGLVMIEKDDCSYCKLWDKEVGRYYPSTPAGRYAPLVKLDIDSSTAQRFQRVVYTPTFILVRSDGKEVGRIIGYPGNEYFWSALEKLLGQAGIRSDDKELPAVVSPIIDKTPLGVSRAQTPAILPAQ